MTSFWHPFADMAAVEAEGGLSIVRGLGSHIWDAAGNRYLDATAGLWFCNVGHGRTEIADAARRQMAELAAHSTFGDLTNPPTEALAERVAGLAPMPNAKVFLTSGGSDRKSTRLNSSHQIISYAVFCLIPPPSKSTLFPYTTLFRSVVLQRRARADRDRRRRPAADGGARGPLDLRGPHQPSHRGAGGAGRGARADAQREGVPDERRLRSEEHTSELQSPDHLVCRLLLDPSTLEIYTLSLHDALPICGSATSGTGGPRSPTPPGGRWRSSRPTRPSGTSPTLPPRRWRSGSRGSRRCPTRRCS